MCPQKIQGSLTIYPITSRCKLDENKFESKNSSLD